MQYSSWFCGHCFLSSDTRPQYSLKFIPYKSSFKKAEHFHTTQYPFAKVKANSNANSFLYLEKKCKYWIFLMNTLNSTNPVRLSGISWALTLIQKFVCYRPLCCFPWLDIPPWPHLLYIVQYIYLQDAGTQQVMIWEIKDSYGFQKYFFIHMCLYCVWCFFSVLFFQTFHQKNFYFYIANINYNIVQ